MGGGRTVRIGFPATFVAQDAFAIDHEGGGPVADFCVDSHLKGNPVHRTDGMRRVHEEGKTHVFRAEACFLEQELGGPLFVGIDRENDGIEIFLFTGKFVAQLRELAMTNRSGVAVDKHEDDGGFASKIAQLDCFATE